MANAVLRMRPSDPAPPPTATPPPPAGDPAVRLRGFSRRFGETPKIALIALGTMFPIYLNLYNGIRGVDPKLIEAARSFGLRGWSLIADVVLPGALPSFLLGLRYALAGSWLTLVVAEQINASAGLGYLINNARDFSRTDEIVVCLIVYALLGLTADAIVRALERRALAWRPSFIKS